MAVPAGHRLSDTRRTPWARRWRRAPLRFLDRGVCRAHRSLGRAAVAEVLGEFEPAADAGVDALLGCESAASPRISGLSRRAVCSHRVARGTDAARGHNLVSPQHVAGGIL